MQTDPISNSTNASLTLASRGMINNVNIAFVPRQVVDTLLKWKHLKKK